MRLDVALVGQGSGYGFACLASGFVLVAFVPHSGTLDSVHDPLALAMMRNVKVGTAHWSVSIDVFGPVGPMTGDPDDSTEGEDDESGEAH